jgi:hypothetical protein
MTAMTPNDIKDRVKRLFGDESGAQVTDNDILMWINDAQREAAMQLEGMLRTTSTVNSVANSGSYVMPTGALTLLDISYKGASDGSYHKLRYLSPNEMDEYVDGWDGTEFGAADPQVYSRGQESNAFGSSFIVHPRPATSITAAFKVEYIRYPNPVASYAGTIDLPEYLHLYVLEYCLMKAYEMDEDWEAADKKASYIQSTLDFNNGKEAWFGQQSYPVVGTTSEDYY